MNIYMLGPLFLILFIIFYSVGSCLEYDSLFVDSQRKAIKKYKIGRVFLYISIVTLFIGILFACVLFCITGKM